MKKVLFIFALIATAMAQSQNTPFVDYMLGLQFATENYYDSMLDVFTNTRRQLADHLMDLNTIGVTELTEAIREVTVIGLEAMEWIEEASGDETCLRTAVDHWEQEKVNIGVSLSSCVDQFSAPIVHATGELLALITEHSQIAFEAQNLVLNTFAEINPITDQSSLTPAVSDRVDAIYQQFQSDTIPALAQLVNVFQNFNETLPFEIRTCLHADVVRMTDESLVLRNTLELC